MKNLVLNVLMLKIVFMMNLGRYVDAKKGIMIMDSIQRNAFNVHLDVYPVMDLRKEIALFVILLGLYLQFIHFLIFIFSKACLSAGKRESCITCDSAKNRVLDEGKCVCSYGYFEDENGECVRANEC